MSGPGPQAAQGSEAPDLTPVERAHQGGKLTAREARQTIQALTQAVTEFQCWSRRYCDGRHSYAPSSHNMMTQKVLSLGVTLEIPDGTPWAGEGEAFGSGPLQRRDPERLAALSAAVQGRLKPALSRLDAEALDRLDQQWSEPLARQVSVERLLGKLGDQVEHALDLSPVPASPGGSGAGARPPEEAEEQRQRRLSRVLGALTAEERAQLAWALLRNAPDGR